MSRLLRVELTRLVLRRAVQVLLALAIVIPTVIGVARVINTSPPSAEDYAEAEAIIAQEVDSPWFAEELDRCEKHPRRYGVRAGGDVRARCERMMTPSVEGYVWYDKLRLAEERDAGSGLAVVTVLAILMLLAGTTFAGHDWASGSMSNQLLFEPRRFRVWVAKGAVVGAIAGVLSAVVMTIYWLALYAVARSRDLDVRDGVLRECLQMGWRGAVVAAGVAVLGYALTMFFRSTVAALGVMLALGLAGGVVLAVIGIDTVWNPGLNLASVILDGARYYVEVPCPQDAGGGICEEPRVLSQRRASAYLGALGAVAVAASVAAFHRRDVP
jgi:hypothetical protein